MSVNCVFKCSSFRNKSVLGEFNFVDDGGYNFVVGGFKVRGRLLVSIELTLWGRDELTSKLGS